MQAQVVLYTPHPHRHHSPRQKFAVLFHLFIVENNSLALAVMYHTRHRLNSHTPSHISKHHKWRNIIQLFYLVYRFHRSTRKLINLTAPHPLASREQLSQALQRCSTCESPSGHSSTTAPPLPVNLDDAPTLRATSTIFMFTEPSTSSPNISLQSHNQ